MAETLSRDDNRDKIVRMLTFNARFRIGLLGSLALVSAPTTHAWAVGSEPQPFAWSTAQPQKKGKARATQLQPFVGELSAAKESGKERNVPILIHLILEGEPENDSYRDTVLPNKDLIAASELAVVLIANNGEHELKTIQEEIEGNVIDRQVCSVYPWFQNCGQHRAPWDSLYIAYHDDAGDLSCPQTILIAPDGKQAWRQNDGHPASTKDVIAELLRAQKAAGPGLSKEELGAIHRHEREARRATDGKLWGAAWREWKSVLSITEVGAYADLARKELEPLEAQMSRETETIAAKLVPGQAAEAYARLSDLLEDWKDTPGEDGVAKVMRNAEKDKAIKDEIRDWKFEQEAAALLEDARACEQAGDDKGLRKALRKLFTKKYAATRAHAAARESYPEHAPPADGD